MRKLLTSLILFPLVCLAIDQGSTHIKGTLTVDSTVSFSQPVPIASGGTGASSQATARTNLGLGSVENTALSTWAGSTNITTLGTISTGSIPQSKITGLTTSDTPSFYSTTLTGRPLQVTSGGTGSSTAAAAIVAIGGKAANGFVNRTDSSLSMSGSTFQITTSGSYDFYSAGTKFTKSTTQSISISSDLTLSYVYFDTAGALQVSAGTAWSITSDNVPVAMVYRDGSTYCIMDERHGWKRDRDWHAWAHETIGTRWHIGLAATFTNVGTSQAFSVTSGEIDDEDIHHAISTQLDSPRIWYRNSTTSMRVMPSNAKKSYATLSGTDIAYDANGTLTQVTNNQHVCVYAYATNDKDFPLYIIAGQAQHTTIALARAESLPTIQLPSAEWKLLAKAIYKSNGASAPTLMESADYRTTQTLALTATATDHQSLANRDAANAHPQSAITGLTTSDSPNFAGLSIGANALLPLDVNATGYQYGSTNFYGITRAHNGTSGVVLGRNNSGTIGAIAGINSLGFWTYDTGWSERMRIDSAGKIGIGIVTPESKLTVMGGIALGTSSAYQYSRIEVADSMASATDARFLFRNGTDTHAALRINAYTSVSIDAVQANDSAINKNLIIQPNGGQAAFGGFTKLGNDSNHPAIKIKKLTGYTAETEGGTAYQAHGLTGDKIISMSCIVRDMANHGRPPNFDINSYAGYKYNFFYNSSNIYVVNDATNSENILDNPSGTRVTYCVTIIYEE